MGKGPFAIVLYKNKIKENIIFWHDVKAQVEGNIGHCYSNRKSTARDESWFVLLAAADN